MDDFTAIAVLAIVIGFIVAVDTVINRDFYRNN